MKCLKGAPKSPLVIFTYKNNYDWIRISSDGWCEQGSGVSVNGWKNITFLIPYKDTTFHIEGTPDENTGDYSTCHMPIANNSRTGATVAATWYTNSYPTFCTWSARGYVDLEDPVVKKFIDDNK